MLQRGGEAVDNCLMDEQMRTNVDAFAEIVEDVVGGAVGIEIAGCWFVARPSVIASAIALKCPSNGARTSHASLLPPASIMGASCGRHRSRWPRMRGAEMESAARFKNKLISSGNSNRFYWFSIIACYFSRLWRRTTS